MQHPSPYLMKLPLPLLDEIEDLKKNCPLQGIIENYSKITINLCCEKKP